MTRLSSDDFSKRSDLVLSRVAARWGRVVADHDGHLRRVPVAQIQGEMKITVLVG